jgi:purine nucleotide phosphorylase
VTSAVEQAAAMIAKQAGGKAPRFGIVLGSGLGEVVELLDDPVTIDYRELPGFPSLTLHAGHLVLGRIADTTVACLVGRAHYYEGFGADAMSVPVRTLAAAGCETLLITNAAGSLREEAGPGSLVLLTDHINFAAISPLFGEQGDARFVDLTEAYDPALREQMLSAAQRLDIELHQGVYIWFSGPNFETPAEIRAARLLGADVVGMSTVPEVILARHAGLRVAAISVVVNLAAGMTGQPLSHDQTLEAGAHAAKDLARLIVGFLEAEAPR